MPMSAQSSHTENMPSSSTLSPHRIHPLQWAMAACAVLAMFSAHWGYFSAYALFKPLTMVLALICVGVVAGRSPLKKSMYLLLAGLALSMVGDVCLLMPQGFLAGLVAFLLAHVCYIALFQRDAPWLASRLGLAACIAAGAVAYGYLWTHGLPTAMRIPVAIYVLVIGMMAAQALGRATVLHTAAARTVAWGAVSFMVSDTVLALDRFVQPIAGAYLWVLGTYYLAQCLILHGMLQTLRAASLKQ